MISGANEKELNVANDIADLLLEIQRLNNNWNELKEWLENVDTFQMNFIKNKEHITPFKAVLDKMKELEEVK